MSRRKKVVLLATAITIAACTIVTGGAVLILYETSSLAEIRVPFVRAGLVTGSVGFVVVVVSAAGFLFILNPLIRRLESTEVRNQAILDTAVDGFLTIDEKGIIESANPAAERMFGYEQGELIGRSVNILMGIPYSQEHDGYIRRYLQTGHKTILNRRREVPGLRKDGTTFVISLGVAELRLGNRRMFTGVTTDVTERQQAESRLREACDKLEEQNREIEQFSYIVSHDLKSPLVTILGFAGHIRRDAAQGNTDRTGDHVDRIERAAGHMKQLIDDILELSRIGRVTRPAEAVRVTELVHSLIEEKATLLAARGITVEIQADMPAIRADRERIAQIFENLLGNAIKYGSDAEQPRITVSAELTADEIRFFVRDNGVGIPREFHSKVFDLFRRLAVETEGSGIGLMIVKRIAELYGGRAWVESSVGTGATFWVGFPRSLLVAEQAR